MGMMRIDSHPMKDGSIVHQQLLKTLLPEIAVAT
jgi:hypothetical protein